MRASSPVFLCVCACVSLFFFSNRNASLFHRKRNTRKIIRACISLFPQTKRRASVCFVFFVDRGPSLCLKKRKLTKETRASAFFFCETDTTAIFIFCACMQKTSRLLSGKREFCGNKIQWKRDTTDHQSVFYLHRLRVCACTSIILQGQIHKTLILWSIRSTKTLIWWSTRWSYDRSFSYDEQKCWSYDRCVFDLPACVVCVWCVFLETESLLCSIGNEIRENLPCLFRVCAVHFFPPLTFHPSHCVSHAHTWHWRSAGHSVLPLQYAARHCNTLPHTAGLKSLWEATGMTGMHASILTLQHTATLCNTLQVWSASRRRRGWRGFMSGCLFWVCAARDCQRGAQGREKVRAG